MGLFLLDVRNKKDSMYKMEIFNKEKKEVDIIRKEFNLPTSKVLLYKDDDIAQATAYRNEFEVGLQDLDYNLENQESIEEVY